MVNSNFYLQDHQGPRCNKEGLIILRELRACLARSADEQVEPLGEGPDRTYGLDLYDVEARQYDAIAPWFTCIDPLAEKYYSISPYAYCAGDPVNLIDPTGCEFDSVSMQYVDMFESETNNRIQKNEATINKLQSKKQNIFRKKKIERLQRQNSGLKTAMEELTMVIYKVI